MAKIFTPQVFDQISNLVAQGVAAAEIAKKIGCTLNSLRVKCSQHGICLRRRSGPASECRPQERLTVKLAPDIVVLLHQQAWKRDTSGPRFAAALLEAVLRDNLCDAVIDQDAVARSGTKEIRNGHDRSSRPQVRGAPTAALRPQLVAKR